MVRYIRSQIDEISGDRGLCLYGAAVALTNAVTALFWLTDQPLGRVLGQRLPSVCWPFLESCYQWRIVSPESINLAVSAFLVFAVVNAVLFLERGHAPTGWCLLAAMTAGKIVILAQDFRLTMNQHYMSLWIAVVFLVIPAKRWILPRLICSFYVAAGFLKLNPEWLSGAGLYGRRPFGMPPQAVSWACAYVIGLELLIVFGLFSRHRWIFWSSLAQLVLFHIGSFWVVGFFYPLLMFCILAIFPIVRLSQKQPARTSLSSTKAFSSGGTVRAGIAVLAAFFALQLVPHFLSADPALTGEGRIFALNMFDAPLQCRGTATVHRADTTVTLPLAVPLTQARLSCDPILYLEIAKSMCRLQSRLPGFANLDLRLDTRRTTEVDYRRVIDLPSFCSSQIGYSFLRHNSWLQIH